MPPTPGLLRAAARLCPRPGGGDGCHRVAGVGPGEGDVRRFEPSPRSQPVTSLFEPRSTGLSVTVFVSQGALEPCVHAPNRRHGCVRLRGARTPSGAAAAPPPRAPHRGGPFPHRAPPGGPGGPPAPAQHSGVSRWEDAPDCGLERSDQSRRHFKVRPPREGGAERPPDTRRPPARGGARGPGPSKHSLAPRARPRRGADGLGPRTSRAPHDTSAFSKRIRSVKSQEDMI